MSVKNKFAAPSVGDTLTFRKTMTVAEQAMFTGISGNLGGLYVDRAKAGTLGLGDMAVFELAIASLLTTCLSRLAGPGHRISRFDAEFLKPVSVGTTVEAEVKLESINDGQLTFGLGCKADGALICEGKALMAPVVEA